MMDPIPLYKVIIAFGILLVTSVSDWRSRMAQDRNWVLLGTLGIAFLGAQMLVDGVSSIYYLFLIPVAVFFYDIFWDREEEGIHIVPIVLYVTSFAIIGYLLWELRDAAYLWSLMIIPMMFLVIIVLYSLDLIKGGADAKALIALSIMFPTYPIIDGFPLIAVPSELAEAFFPFPLVILFNAALLVMVLPLAFMVRNLIKGEARIPLMFFGYRMDVSEARERFVWPLEVVNDGALKVVLFPKSGEDEWEKRQYDKLDEIGVTRVWVTPKVPFLIPMTMSLLFSALIGNLVFLIVG